jgi:ABC-type bacteriocin/lantibiotic exporter with double-glycine peptidase domain
MSKFSFLSGGLASRIGQLIREERIEIRNVIFYAVVSGLLSLSLPLGIQAVINFLNAGKLSTSWAVLVIFVLLGIVLVGVLQIRQLTLTERIERSIFTKTSFDFAFRLPRLKQSAIQGKYLPELVNRFFEIITVQKGFSKVLVDVSSACIQIIFGLILLSFYHSLFILFGLLLITLLYIMLRLTIRPGMQTSLEESKYKYEVAHWLEEIGRAMNTFKFMGNSPLPVSRTDEFVHGYLVARKKHFRILQWQYGAMVAFKFAVAAGLLILGSVLVIDRQINIGQFVASEIIILLTMTAVEKLVFSMQTIYDLLTALEKLGAVADLPMEENNGTVLNDVHSSALKVEFKDLSFTYPDGVRSVLKNFNLSIEPGQSVALYGDHGSGKTTALKLLTGLFDQYTGSITINGFPITSLKISALRAMTGDNFIECPVFKGTIQENIQADRSNVTLEDVMWAAKLAGLEELIANAPKGLNTPIDPEGRRFSNTIIQQIILARSIVIRPKLLLVEDHISGMSPALRKRIFSGILHLGYPCTVIIASNDPLIQDLCSQRVELKR